MSSISSWKYEYWFTKYVLRYTLSYYIFMVRGWVLISYFRFVYFSRYPNTFFDNSRCTAQGDTENLLRCVTAYIRSNIPVSINHGKYKIIFWNYWRPLSSGMVFLIILGVPWLLVVILTSWYTHIFLTPSQYFLDIIIWGYMHLISQFSQFIYYIVFWWICNITHLKMLFNFIRVIVWFLWRNDNVIYMSGYIVIPIIFIWFPQPQVLVFPGWSITYIYE